MDSGSLVPITTYTRNLAHEASTITNSISTHLQASTPAYASTIVPTTGDAYNVVTYSFKVT